MRNNNVHAQTEDLRRRIFEMENIKKLFTCLIEYCGL